MSDARADPSGFILPCGSCGKRNRLSYANFGKTIRCGNCRTPLPAIGSPVTVPTNEAFEALVRSSPVPVLVDFWAAWCGPCHMVAPELVKVAAREAGRLVVAKVNTEELPDLSARFRVQSIPTLVLIEGGQEVGRTSGARPAEGILQFVAQTARA